MVKNVTIRSTLAAIACAISISAHALADSPKRVDVPAGDLTSALQTLAKQSGVEFVYSSEQLKGVHTEGVHGEYTAEKAVTKLLEGTKLKLTVHESGALLISGNTLENPSRPSDPDSVKLEEVIVTSQRREERLLDVPISIAAVGSEELHERHVTSLEDLAFVVPDLSVNSDGQTRTIQIRGISNSGGGVEPLVGVYLDEADVTLLNGGAINPKVYDLARVEVLRGPQGTLYGEGSAGGTVRFITNNPDPNHLLMESDVAALFTQGGAPGQRVAAMLNVPLMADELGVRLSGAFNREGGWIDQPAVGQQDINAEDLTSVRIKGLWRPAANLTISAMAQIDRDDRSSGTGEDSHGNFTQVFGFPTTPKVKQDEDLYNLTMTYDFPSLRILSTSTYLKALNEVRNFAEGPFEFPPAGSPLLYYYVPSNPLKNQAIVEELRVSSLGSGPWQWTAGAFYRHFRNYGWLGLPDGYYYGAPGPASAPLPPAFDVLGSDTLYKSGSVFADISYRIAPELVIGAGGRYFRENQTSNTIDLTAQTGTSQSGKFHSVDPRAYIRYTPTTQVNIYASAAKGFRSGGFNLPADLPSFDPERVWSYELGTKLSLLQGRLRFDAALFSSDYGDYQVQGLTPAQVFLTKNAGDARIYGGDWDVTWRPSRQWTAGFKGSYIHSRFTSISLTSTAHQVGDQLDLVPKYQYTVLLQRDFELEGKLASVRVDYSQQGPETYRDRAAGFFNESDTVRLLDLNLHLNLTQSVGVGLFVQNLRNDRGYTTPFAFISDAPRVRPRTYGVEFTASFD